MFQCSSQAKVQVKGSEIWGSNRLGLAIVALRSLGSDDGGSERHRGGHAGVLGGGVPLGRGRDATVGRAASGAAALGDAAGLAATCAIELVSERRKLRNPTKVTRLKM